ncbi:uncharacterized protein J4E87_008544 [Alternaria ethzedia]|uniref:uncharacterized protein n=1 Tax=Alternaria ethzedia TaxID=181014 RepID=UPI0020C4C653|nr:uncharacterized protein J4E87_008544 [Alternaria ethzedia]KAI4617032.1 hypothetical protein J4E87_008544 [Alternaria ethzedia]
MTNHDPDKDTPKGIANKNLMVIESQTASPSTPIGARAPVPFGPPIPRLADTRLEKVPGGLKDPSRLKTKISQLLDKDGDYPEVDGFRFKTLEEARAPMDEPQWYSPEVDPSIPETDAEYRKFVEMLMLAFKDMTRAKDTQGNAYRKRLTPGEGVYYQDWAIEACSWDIVGMAKDIHLNGFKVRIYDKSIIDNISQTKDWTFGQRIEWICAVLRTSKQIGVTLMKNEKTWTTIGAPHKLYSSTIVNCVSNAHRGQWIKVGRDNDQHHQNRPIRGRRTAAEMIASGDNDDTDDSGVTPGSQMMLQPRQPAQKRQKRSQPGMNVIRHDHPAMANDSEGEMSPGKMKKKRKTTTQYNSSSPTYVVQSETSASQRDKHHPGADIGVTFSDVLPMKHVVAVPVQAARKNGAQADDVVFKDAFSKDVFSEGANGKNASNDGGDGSIKDKGKGKMKKTKDTGFVNYHCGTKGMDELDSDSFRAAGRAPGGFTRTGSPSSSELSDAPDDLLSPGSGSPTPNHKQKELLDDPEDKVSIEEYAKLRGEMDELKAAQAETDKILAALRAENARSLASFHQGS